MGRRGAEVECIMGGWVREGISEVGIDGDHKCNQYAMWPVVRREAGALFWRKSAG